MREESIVRLKRELLEARQENVYLRRQIADLERRLTEATPNYSSGQPMPYKPADGQWD